MRVTLDIRIAQREQRIREFVRVRASLAGVTPVEARRWAEKMVALEKDTHAVRYQTPHSVVELVASDEKTLRWLISHLGAKVS